MYRQIILDTETTGINVEEGHRLIEIACVEMIDRKLTGKHFHRYVNPEREVEAGAFAVHGIGNDFLRDKPLFQHIAEELMDFILDAELIIHNAPFDLSFINNEFLVTKQKWKAVTDHCRVIDTLAMARKMHVGQKNSLDALCKRYHVDNSKRELHGALLDCHLLAQVYLAMTGGQGSFFDSISENQSVSVKNASQSSVHHLEKHNISVLRASVDELTEHEKYLELLKKHGKCVWSE